MPGRNKVSRWMRAFVGGYDLSGDARTLGVLENSYGDADMMAWSDWGHNFLVDGHRKVGVTGFQAFLDDAASGAWSVLKQAASTTRQVTMAFGSGAEPALADAAYILAGAQAKDNEGHDANKPVLNADFYQDQPQYSANADNPWGLTLQAAVSLAGTTTGSSIDNLAASASGGHANLHVIASSGGTWSIKVQHSTDNSSWSDLLTFTSTGAAIGGEHKTVAGTVNRYTRALLTRTSGTVTAFIAFARN